MKSALIVEDQGITALDLKSAFDECGFFNSTIVASGRKAIEFIKYELITIATLDIKLSDNVSGIEVAKILMIKNVPFVFVSAFSNPENLRLAKELKPLGIIEKPFNREVLKTIISNV